MFEIENSYYIYRKLTEANYEYENKYGSLWRN